MKYIISWVAFLSIIFIAVPLAINSNLSISNSDDKSTVYKKEVRVYFHEEDTVKTMDIEEYLIGVLAAEMPASFEAEALRAQAVAARTYTLNKMKSYAGAKEHKGGDICTDFAHCQAYISVETANKNWGKNASKYFKKCKNAVFDTAGEAAVYEGEPVKAVFHSSGSGKTENAKDVWGGDVPYLVSVDSPGEELSPRYKSKVVKSIDEFKSIILKEYNVSFKDNLIGETKRTDSGAVKSILIGNKTFKGTQIRSMFSLRSANFTVSVSADEVVFDVTGNGHGVGMSQYGANYLASKGHSYKEILKRYYTGIEIKKLY